jgi:1,3-beta-glucanosyltransferase GAS1
LTGLTLLAYHVDPDGDHDGCMDAFAENGIYLFLDVDTFTTQIEETDPMWDSMMYANFTKVIDAFDKYDNLAGFFIANEVFCPGN